MKSDRGIAMTQKLVRKEEILASVIEDQVVMMNIETESYYGTNVVGTRIWELLEQPLTVSELCRFIQEEFDIDDETCQQDMLPFIEEIIDEKLVRIIED